jgi:hypothetical protein
MRLIREQVTETKFIVEEKLGKGKQYFIEGIFLQSELVNRNGRLYQESTMDKEVARYIKESVEQNRAYGELGHPDTPSINLDRVSHLIVDLRKEGTNYIGRAKILETPMGNIARGLLEGGASLGVSSRALGSLKENKDGVQVVQVGLNMAGIDVQLAAGRGAGGAGRGGGSSQRRAVSTATSVIVSTQPLRTRTASWRVCRASCAQGETL